VSKKKKSASKLKKALISTAIAGITIGIMWFTNGRGAPVPVPAYTVLRVIDGDTFETTEHQIIRLASTEAPEVGLCGGEEATEGLKKLILNKPVYLKVLYRDRYDRLDSQVYTQDGYVNELMISQGYAFFHNRYGKLTADLKNVYDLAQKNKIGIYSTKCTQKENPKNLSCNIKGNVRSEKVYHTPNCRDYELTDLQLYLGDQWFCSEKEAELAGFRKNKYCP